MVPESWRILIIEDKEDLANAAKREITDAFANDSEIAVVVNIQTDFEEGYLQVKNGQCDLVVLDVYRDASPNSLKDDAAGRKVFLDIKDARFAPVIFWTALPESVADQEMLPLVAVVSKEDLDKLPDAIRAALASMAVDLIARIEQRVADVLKKHMWSELGPHWNEYTQGGDPELIAEVLVSRLARVLEADRERAITSHPSHRYVYPPVTDERTPGDVLRDPSNWWVVLTPACDFVQKKVEYVLLAHADQLTDHPKYKSWQAAIAANGSDNNKWNNLFHDVLMATQGRYYYLPGFREIPDLVVDFENVRAVKCDDLTAFAPVASLAGPFSEAVLVQYSQFRGRIGVPDLDAEVIKKRLLASPKFAT